MKTLKTIGQVAVFFALFDVFIVTMGVAQIKFEGRSGYWSPFWAKQAEFVLNLNK